MLYLLLHAQRCEKASKKAEKSEWRKVSLRIGLKYALVTRDKVKFSGDKLPVSAVCRRSFQLPAIKPQVLRMVAETLLETL
jgi:hypothetical protein